MSTFHTGEEGFVIIFVILTVESVNQREWTLSAQRSTPTARCQTAGLQKDPGKYTKILEPKNIAIFFHLILANFHPKIGPGLHGPPDPVSIQNLD